MLARQTSTRQMLQPPTGKQVEQQRQPTSKDSAERGPSHSKSSAYLHAVKSAAKPKMLDQIELPAVEVKPYLDLLLLPERLPVELPENLGADPLGSKEARPALELPSEASHVYFYLPYLHQTYGLGPSPDELSIMYDQTNSGEISKWLNCAQIIRNVVSNASVWAKNAPKERKPRNVNAFIASFLPGCELVALKLSSVEGVDEKEFAPNEWVVSSQGSTPMVPLLPATVLMCIKSQKTDVEIPVRFVDKYSMILSYPSFGTPFKGFDDNVLTVLTMPAGWFSSPPIAIDYTAMSAKANVRQFLGRLTYKGAAIAHALTLHEKLTKLLAHQSKLLQALLKVDASRRHEMLVKLGLVKPVSVDLEPARKDQKTFQRAAIRLVTDTLEQDGKLVWPDSLVNVIPPLRDMFDPNHLYIPPLRNFHLDAYDGTWLEWQLMMRNVYIMHARWAHDHGKQPYITASLSEYLSNYFPKSTIRTHHVVDDGLSHFSVVPFQFVDQGTPLFVTANLEVVRANDAGYVLDFDGVPEMPDCRAGFVRILVIDPKQPKATVDPPFVYRRTATELSPSPTAVRLRQSSHQLSRL